MTARRRYVSQRAAAELLDRARALGIARVGAVRFHPDGCVDMVDADSLGALGIPARGDDAASAFDGWQSTPVPANRRDAS